MRQRENLISILSPNQSLWGRGSETTGRWGSNSSTEIQMDLYHPISSTPHSGCTTHDSRTNNRLNNYLKRTESSAILNPSNCHFIKLISVCGHQTLWFRINPILHLRMISYRQLCGLCRNINHSLVWTPGTVLQLKENITLGWKGHNNFQLRNDVNVALWPLREDKLRNFFGEGGGIFYFQPLRFDTFGF